MTSKADADLARPVQRSRRRRGPIARWYRRHEQAVLGWGAFIGFFVIWQVGSDAGWINRIFFSSPLEIVAAGVVLVQEPTFWSHFRVSAIELVAGSVLALLLGVPIGIAIGWYTRAGYLFDPWLNFFNALPRIAFLPIVVLWVGLGIEAKITIVFLGAFFALVIPTAHGVRTTDRQLLDVASSFGAGQMRIFTSVVLPATLPFIVGGLRQAIPRALVGVIIGEFFAQTEGLGVIIARASRTLSSDRMLFVVLIFSCAGILATLALNRAAGYLERWRPRGHEEE